MNKLLAALLVSAMALSTPVLAAGQDGQTSQSSQGKPDTAQSGANATGEMPKDCSNLSGKEKDKCIQATPAGPVDAQTGEQRKGRSDIAKERDRQKEQHQPETNAPAQSNEAVGRPAEESTTGQAQTGANTDKDTPSTNMPDQSKDTVGHPEERKATGEGQSGQEPGQGVARKSQ